MRLSETQQIIAANAAQRVEERCRVLELRREKAILMRVPAAQRTEARRRRIILDRFQEALRRAGYQNVVQVETELLQQLRAEGHPISKRTLENWRRGYRLDGIAGLIDRRCGWTPPRAPKFLSEVARLADAYPTLKAEMIHTLARAAALNGGWQAGTIQQTRQAMKGLRGQVERRSNAVRRTIEGE